MKYRYFLLIVDSLASLWFFPKAPQLDTILLNSRTGKRIGRVTVIIKVSNQQSLAQ